MNAHHDERSRLRAEVIMKVCSGAINATEGAKQLQISRKTYYEWEKRGLAALLESLQDGEAGRPVRELPDPEKSAMEEKLKAMERELAVAKQTIEVKRMLDAYQQQRKSLQAGSDKTGKKNRKSKR
jgi:hypothetical protein